MSDLRKPLMAALIVQGPVSTCEREVSLSLCFSAIPGGRGGSRNVPPNFTSQSGSRAAFCARDPFFDGAR